MQSIAKTAAVFHRICHYYPHGYHRHERHKGHCQLRNESALNCKEQENADTKLYGCEENCHGKQCPIGQNTSHSDSPEIVLQLILRTNRVYCFHKTREDERHCHDDSAEVDYHFQ